MTGQPIKPVRSWWHTEDNQRPGSAEGYGFFGDFVWVSWEFHGGLICLMGFEWWFDGFIWIFGGLKAKI